MQIFPDKTNLTTFQDIPGLHAFSATASEFPNLSTFFSVFFSPEKSPPRLDAFPAGQKVKKHLQRENTLHTVISVCGATIWNTLPRRQITAPSTRTHSLRYSRRSHTFCKAFNNRAAYACVNAVLFTVLSLLLPTS